MAIEVRERVIAGTRYRVAQLGAKKGRAMLVRLVKLAGPGLAAGLSGLSKTDAKDSESALARGVSDALYDLASRLDAAELGTILDELAERTTLVLEGDREPQLKDRFDDHFAGKYDEMLRWAAFALEVNFGSFFDGTGGPAGFWARVTALTSVSPSPTPSTGTSTA